MTMIQSSRRRGATAAQYYLAAQHDLRRILVEKVFVVAFAVLAYVISAFQYFTDAKAVAYPQIGDPKYNAVNNETYVTSMMLFPYMIIITCTVLYLMITRATRKGAGVIVFFCLVIEIAGFFVYSAALENLLSKGKDRKFLRGFYHLLSPSGSPKRVC